MAPEKDKHEREPKVRKGAEREPAETARGALAETTAEGLTATAKELAERLGVPFMTYEQAKQQGLIVQNATGNWEPAPGHRFVDNPAKREKHLRNWAVKNWGDSARERAKLKKLPFMTHEEAVRKKLVARNPKGNWEPAQGYEWVDYPKTSDNWAVRRKLPPPATEPERKAPAPKRSRPKKPSAAPRKTQAKAPAKPIAKASAKAGPKPVPKLAPAPIQWPRFNLQLLTTVKFALDTEGITIPPDEEIDLIAETTYLAVAHNYENPNIAIIDPIFIDSVVSEIRFRELAKQTAEEPPNASASDIRPQQPAPEVVDFDIDDLPELNNNGHVSIIIAGGRGRGEAGLAGGTGLFDGIKQIIYDPVTNRLVIVDILRDIVGNGRKLNARTKNNMGRLEDIVQDMTGESTTYTLRLTLETMRELGDVMIRILGPIEIDMQHNYVGFVGGKAILFPKHTVIDSGEKLLHFAQFRKGLIVRDDYPYQESTTDVARGAAVKPYIIQRAGGSDDSRVSRQSLALRALITAFTKRLEGEKGLIASGVEKVFGRRAGFAVDNLGSIKDIYDVVSDNTNVGLTDIPAFLAMAKLFKRGGARIEKIPGNMEGKPYYRRKVAQAAPPNKFAKVKIASK